MSSVEQKEKRKEKEEKEGKKGREALHEEELEELIKQRRRVERKIARKRKEWEKKGKGVSFEKKLKEGFKRWEEREVTEEELEPTEEEKKWRKVAEIKVEFEKSGFKWKKDDRIEYLLMGLESGIHTSKERSQYEELLNLWEKRKEAKEKAERGGEAKSVELKDYALEILKQIQESGETLSETVVRLAKLKEISPREEEKPLEYAKRLRKLGKTYKEIATALKKFYGIERSPNTIGKWLRGETTPSWKS